MPIYEYRCSACDHELEALQKVSDEPLKKCPSCEADALVKKVSAAAFRLKGGGWYETDFKKEGRRNLAGDKSSASTTSDSKPAASSKKDASTSSKSSSASA